MRDYDALAEGIMNEEIWPFRDGDWFGKPKKLELPPDVKPAIPGAMMTDEQYMKEMAYVPNWGGPGLHLDRFMRMLMQTKGWNANFHHFNYNFELYNSARGFKDHVMGLLHAMEIPYDMDEPIDDTWDGQKLHLGRLAGGMTGILHEICHWQVASAEHRFKREYALGPFSSNNSDARKEWKAPDEDETTTCLLSSFWVTSWGMSPIGLMADLNVIWTPDPSGDAFDRAYTVLTASGLIDHNFTPALAARLRERRKR